MNRPVIIEAALNGATLKFRNPHLPETPEEIAADSLRCLKAGAGIIHNHIPDISASPEAAATEYIAGWKPVLRERPDAIVYPTVGLTGDVESRFKHFELIAQQMKLRAGIVDPGSVNLGGADENGLPVPIEMVYINSYADIHHQIELCRKLQLGPSVAIFEPGFLRVALAFHRAGKLPRGTLIKFYFGGDEGYLGTGFGGVSFGLPPTKLSLECYLAMLEGTDLPWSTGVLGGDVIASGMARLAIERGGHLHVGLEDWAGQGTPSNEQLVKQAAELITSMGYSIASCEQTAELLRLPQ